MVHSELQIFLKSGEMLGEPVALSNEIIDFSLQKNNDEFQKSFYFPNDKEEIEELVNEGAVCYVVYDGGHSVKACAFADPVEDNKTVEVSGPFGSTEDRIGLLRRIKLDFPGYEVMLFVSEKNELGRCFRALSCEASMEIVAEKSEVMGVSEYNEKTDSLELHDRLFPDAYSNAESLSEDYDILVYREKDEVVGYIAYEKEESYLDFVAVNPEYRRRGIAKKLILAALNDMKGKTVRLTVNSENTEAIDLYKSLGFKLKDYMIALHVLFTE